MQRIILPLVEKSLGIEIEECLAWIGDPGRGDHARLCLLHRQIAVAAFLQSADPAHLVTWLFRSTCAAIDGLQRGALPPPSDALAWDEIIAGDPVLATDLLAEVRRCEPDGLAVPVLALFTGGTDVAIGPAAARRPFAAAVVAIAAGDAEAWSGAMEEALDAQRAAALARVKSGSGDPDAAVTTDRVSLAGIALVLLARRRGLAPPFHHRLVPPDALLRSRSPLPARDAWRTIDTYRSFEA